uniref:Uncharacterized protein n=1 Tax=Plectus sambesii TaxID=2011161 RepID=A0A914VS72_9BILA
MSPLKAAAQSSSGPATDEENLEKAAALVRKFLVFFMPPKYKLTKEKVGKMPADELFQVDVEAFQQAYELGLREMLDHHRNSAKTANDNLAS